MAASSELNAQLRAQLPAQLRVLYELDLDLELAPSDQPGTVRQPDLIVATRGEAARSIAERTPLRASGAVLAIEIVSPGSARTDQLIKRAEYADAGIPHYWIVELEPQVSLTACRLVDGRYVDDGPVSGRYTADAPFPVELDLDALR
jgi:Uma2 family endonuclease